jgi:hypothetical protein
MTTSHPAMSNARFTTFRNTKFVFGLKNITLLDIIVPQQGGI